MAKRANGNGGSTGYQQVFKNVDDILHKDAGCTSELDYTEQSSWLLFLKYLDALEYDRAEAAQLTGKKYTFILEPKFRWSVWAAPKKPNGEPDHDSAHTGPDLMDFVNNELFPYLRGFKQRANATNTIEYKIGEIFDEIRNRISSGYNMRDVIDELDKLKFRSSNDKHELSDLYEVKIKNMGNAGRNGGEYYTPRPLIRAMIQVVKPTVGETIYDGAVGSAGFLCESFEYLSRQADTTSKMDVLQNKTFYGKEKKSLAYVIAVMNMILHGIDAPNIIHTNTLSENLSQIQEKDRYDIVLANPPFGGKERAEVQQNFPIRSSETAYLFLQHFIKSLKAGGRAAIVIKNTFLSNMDAASVALRKHLLESCDLHTVLDLPSGVFQGAGVKTVVLFFQKGTPTKAIWYYQLQPGRKLGKTNPLNDKDLEDFVLSQGSFASSTQSWTVPISEIDTDSYELTPRNPDTSNLVIPKTMEEVRRNLAEIELELLDAQRDLDNAISESRNFSVDSSRGWEVLPLSAVGNVDYGTRVVRKRDGGSVYDVYGGGDATFKIDRFNREDCVIVARFGMSEQCVRRVDGQFFLNDSGLSVSSKDESVLLQDFLDRALLSLQKEIFAMAKGTAQLNLDVTEFKEMPIRFPRDLQDQKKFVEVAHRVERTATHLQVVLQRKMSSLKDLHAASMREAFTELPDVE